MGILGLIYTTFILRCLWDRLNLLIHIKSTIKTFSNFHTPRNDVRGDILVHPVCLSVCPPVCPLTFRVRPVASTVQNGFFPYLVQMISSMRECVACDELWTWPISPRSFDLDFENIVCSVTLSVLDQLFPYLPQKSLPLEGVSRGEFIAKF